MTALLQSWLGGLSARERLLLGAAATLVAVLGLTSFVLTPLRAAHERARLDYEGSALELIEARGAAAMAAARTTSAVAVGEDMRAAVTRTALDRGLAIARMTPVDQDGLAVRLDSADPATLYAWLAALDAGQGVAVRRASLRRVIGAETIEADLVLGLAGGAS